MPTREEMWDRLGEPVDLLIIGGGINGAGIARDAARRGLKVALVEMNDLATGTSSRSSKLVHGGLRYLEQLEFSLVFESVSERRILMDIAPHIVNPLGFLFPVYKTSRRQLPAIRTGMWLYEGLSLFRSPKRHRTLKPADIAREEPALGREGLKGAPLYYDCSTDDARLTLESALDAVEQGAVVCTYAKAVELLRVDGHLNGAIIEDVLSGARQKVRAHAVINATGPWTDLTAKLGMGGSPVRELLRPTKGTHIVVDASRLPLNNAVVVFHPRDGRVLFAIPWGEQSYLGTTDTDFQGDPGQVWATLEDVDYLLEASNATFPEHPLTRADVISTWSGLRPLMAPPETKGGVSESAVSREHQILVREDGLITIAGGKLTTYRRMSAEVVDTAVKLLRLAGALPAGLKDAHTDRAPLPGAVGWPADDDHARVAAQVAEAAAGALSPASAALLANTYGMQALKIAAMIAAEPALAEPLVPGRAEVLAQVRWSVEAELASSVLDVLMIRTQLFYRDAAQGLGAVERVAQLMAERLGWDDAQRQRHIDRYRREVEGSRRWRAEVEATP